MTGKADTIGKDTTVGKGSKVGKCRKLENVMQYVIPLSTFQHCPISHIHTYM